MIKPKHTDEWKCEAGVDVDRSGHAPRIILCRKPAKIRGMAALCDVHAYLAYPKHKMPIVTEANDENQKDS